MDKFRTPLPAVTIPVTISHQTPILNMGSCFAENMGLRLQQLKFPVYLNPFGILYNPISIAKGLAILLEGKPMTASDLFEHNGLWHSFQHHSRFSSVKQQQTLQLINQSILQAQQYLQQTQCLILTFGTAYVFEYLEHQQIVANCHKLPARLFQRKRLTVNEIVEHFTPILQQLKQRLPKLNIILSVSPIRHIKDGLVENQRSKSILLLATEQLTQCFDFVHYFPAYEIMLDDLRDYRFYTADMIHPSEVAIDYIWNYFQQTFFDNSTLQLNQRIHRIKQAAQHRPFNPLSVPHQRFVKQQLDKIEALEKEAKFLEFEEERSNLLQSLKSSSL